MQPISGNSGIISLRFLPQKPHYYDIILGDALLLQAGALLTQHFPQARFMVISDDNVTRACLPHLRAGFAAAHKAETLLEPAFIVQAGEASKNFTTLERLLEALLAAKLQRSDIVLALGGGIVGDIASLAASLARRGLGFVQIPTSLLAQIDAAIGGKTAINSRFGKNLIGSFYQPKLVLADMKALDTLPKRHFRAGYAEMVKYGLISQPDFFAFLEAEYAAIFAGGTARQKAIAACCRFKADIVVRDEKEAGERALLNFGHSFGHALEAAIGYAENVLLHGEAVSIGMVLACEFSVRLGLADAATAACVERHLRKAGLPTHMADIKAPLPGAEKLMDFMAQDKKRQFDAWTLILTRGIGLAFIARNIEKAEIQAFLAEKLAKIR